MVTLGVRVHVLRHLSAYDPWGACSVAERAQASRRKPKRSHASVKMVWGRPSNLCWGGQLIFKERTMADKRTNYLAAFSEPTVRTYRIWTPELIQAAEALADAGNFSLAAELCDVILSDDAVKGALQQRIGALLDCDIDFEPGRGVKARKAVRSLEAEEDYECILPEEDHFELISWGLMLGIGVATLPWSEDPETGRIIAPIALWHPRSVSFDWIERHYRTLTQDGSYVVITPGDSRWVLYAPYGLHRAWSKGLWRGLARWWLLKQLAIYDWGQSTALNASRVVTTAVDAGASLEDPKVRNQLANQLATMVGLGTCVLPPGADMKLLEVKADSHKAFLDQIEAANAAIATAILCQDMTTSGDGATYASAKVGESVTLRTLGSDAKIDSAIVYKQILYPWAEFNFGDPKSAPYPCRKTEAEEDLATSGANLESLGKGISALNAALATAKKEVDIDALLQRFEVPVRDRSPESVAQDAVDAAATQSPVVDGAVDSPKKGATDGQQAS